MAKKHITFRLEPDIVVLLDDYCNRTMKKRAQVLEQIITRHVKRNPRDFKYGNNPNR